MKRFEWSETIEIAPGQTYIPRHVADNGRERMINCRCGTVPIIKEDLEGEKAMVDPQQLPQKW